MRTEHAQETYNAVIKDVLRSDNPGTVLHEIELDRNSSFAGMIQVYIDKTTTDLKPNAIVVLEFTLFLRTFRNNVIDYSSFGDTPCLHYFPSHHLKYIIKKMI